MKKLIQLFLLLLISTFGYAQQEFGNQVGKK
jgi:hypothetical protein